jgi:chlorophyll synthase
MSVTEKLHTPIVPHPKVMLELIKPVTWFPPMWAYACGVVSSGQSVLPQLGYVVLGVLLSGPIVCGMSQAANDWCDRHVDAINEPHRPIPSGRMPGRWGLWIALAMSVLSLCVGAALGAWGFYATVIGVLAAWAYSVEPFRFKKSGWWGPGLVGLCYEGLPWFTGAAVMAQGFPQLEIVTIAMLYAIGAHGIMTLNDFKALDGDRTMGIKSLPVTLGPKRAARVACYIMTAPQLVVIGLFAYWGLFYVSGAIAALVMGQWWAMARLLRDPKQYAPWYNATGVSMFVSGMMICAIGLRWL